MKFVTGSDCVQRVMVGHLLEHWEWALVAKLTAEVKRVYHKVHTADQLTWLCS